MSSYKHEGVNTRGPESPIQEAIARGYDETGYESLVNHVHIESYVGRELDLSEIQRIGICYAHKLAKNLASEFPGIPFKVVVSFSWGDFPSCVVRFYKSRPGQEWISEDLEGYREEAIMVMDIGP